MLEDVNLGRDALTLLKGLQHTAFHGPLVFTLADVVVQPLDELVEMVAIANRDTEGMSSVLFLQVHGLSLGSSELGHITLSVS